MSLYVHHLRTRVVPHPPRRSWPGVGERPHRANATLQQLTAVRLLYDTLVEDGRRADNPVGRGRYRLAGGHGSPLLRGLGAVQLLYGALTKHRFAFYVAR